MARLQPTYFGHVIRKDQLLGKDDKKPTGSLMRGMLINGALVIAMLVVLAALFYSAIPERCAFDPRFNEFKHFVLRYHQFHNEKERSPYGLDELAAYNPRNVEQVNGFVSYDCDVAFEQIRDGQLDVIWNADLFPDGNINNEYVLAYTKATPDGKCIVVRAGGRVELLSLDEFGNLPKVPVAKPKLSSEAEPSDAAEWRSRAF